MRVTDGMRFALMRRNLGRAQSSIDRIQGMIASGKKVEKPSDDTVVYSRAVQIDAEKSVNGQLGRNLERMKTFGTMYESVFDNVQELLNKAKELALAHANDTVDATTRKNAAGEIRDIIEHLVTLGNTQLSNTYIFGGKRATEAPFELNPDYSVDYHVPYGSQETIDVYVDTAERDKMGFSGLGLFYDKNKVLYENPENSFTGDAYTNGNYYAFVVDSTNDTLYTNGFPVQLDHGVYRGSELARQIQEKLGEGYYATFESGTRRFVIENQVGGSVTFNWSNPGATAATLLGFDRLDSIVETGERDVSDVEAGSASFLVKMTQGGRTTGSLQQRARYRYSLDGGTTWSAEEMIVNAGRTNAEEYVVDSSNNALYLNGAPVTITAGTYTGADLAAEVQARLNAAVPGHTVTYDATTRKFTITNNGAVMSTLNWSKPEATAASLLGFQASDTGIATGASDVSDTEAGLSLGQIFEVGYQVDGTSNQLVVSDGVNDYTVALTTGLYDGATLAAQIQTQLNSTPLGPGLFAVSYNNATRQFTIQNTGAAAYTLRWSDSNSTGSTLLGFDATDTVLAAGASDVSDSATDPRDTIYKDGVAVTLDVGTYTGAGLADEIEGKLGAGFRVEYDAGVRRFAIHNDSGVPVAFNWAETNATVAAMLGFDVRDSIVANGSTDVSDFDAGMLVDGTNGANAVNNRIKIAFGTDGFLAADDSFEVKDLDIFAFLKNFQDALEGNSTTGIQAAVRDLDYSLDVVSKNITNVGMLTNKVDTLIQEKETRDYTYSQITSDMVDADLTQLTAEFNAMVNSYQALLYSMAKLQDLSIMKYM
jgi:flagellar hook-associated protein 3 FlgL